MDREHIKGAADKAKGVENRLINQPEEKQQPLH